MLLKNCQGPIFLINSWVFNLLRFLHGRPKNHFAIDLVQNMTFCETLWKTNFYCLKIWEIQKTNSPSMFQAACLTRRISGKKKSINQPHNAFSKRTLFQKLCSTLTAFQKLSRKNFSHGLSPKKPTTIHTNAQNKPE